ncbi:hypothetical protein DO71_5841 [Burkholderia pseudomallei]|nr:hypothetical protein DO71_5841 [Burkholderia pseudomallei]KGW99055.1 hypothetical protein Y034_6144 [Burkholderia pseudomallei MSHR449]
MGKGAPARVAYCLMRCSKRKGAARSGGDAVGGLRVHAAFDARR